VRYATYLTQRTFEIIYIPVTLQWFFSVSATCQRAANEIGICWYFSQSRFANIMLQHAMHQKCLKKDVIAADKDVA